jgi:hypothetical protein
LYVCHYLHTRYSMSQCTYSSSFVVPLNYPSLHFITHVFRDEVASLSLWSYFPSSSYPPTNLAWMTLPKGHVSACITLQVIRTCESPHPVMVTALRKTNTEIVT